MTTGWDDWEPRAPQARSTRQRANPYGANWIAVAVIAAVTVWALGLFVAGTYAAKIGFPAIQFDNDPGYTTPTTLQENVRRSWGAVQMLTLPVAVVALWLSLWAVRLGGRRSILFAAIGFSGLLTLASMALAFSGVADSVFS